MNTQYQNQTNSGSGDSFADWAAVILTGLLFVRTMDVLSYFSPSVLNEIVGSDVSWLYGATSAFFVEGVALAYHFNKKAQKYTPAKVVKFLLLAISGACQIFDGRLISGTLSEMPEAQKLVFQIGVPLLPLIVLLLLFLVGKLPDENEHRPSIMDVGIKNMLPNFKQLWNGRGVQYPVQTTIVRQIEQQLPVPMPEPDTRADEVGDNADGNFQKGKA